MDLDQIARPRQRVLLGFAHRVGRDRRARRDPGTPVREGSTSRPCRLRCVSMRPSMEVEMPPAGGAAEWPACPCPSAETANAKSKPFLLREKTKSAGGADGDGGSGLPASSDRADHSAVTSDRRSGERARNGDRSEPRSRWCGRNPSRPSAPGRHRRRSALRHVEGGPSAQATAWSAIKMAAGTYGKVVDGFDVTDSLPIPR